MNFLLAIIIPVFLFFLESYPRLFNRYFGVDVWTRLIEIDHIRKENHRIPGKIEKGFIIQGYFDYPPLFPWIFSFFPKKLLLEIQGFIAPFFDSIQNILVFIICYQITGNFYISLIAQLIYAFTPMIAVENSNLTPRSFGYLNFTLAFYPLLSYSINHDIILFFIGTFFTSLLFLSHRFALQSFIFIIVFFTIFDRSLMYFIAFLTGFVIAMIVTKGYYLRVAKGHLFNIYFWVKNYKYRFANQIYGLRKPNKIDWVAKVYFLLSYFSPILIFGINIWVISSFIYLYLNIISNVNALNSQILFKMSVWVIFFYILAIFVLKIKKLIPIGEGQRYIEMATVPSSILSSVLFFYFYNSFGNIAIIILALIMFVNLATILTIQIKGIIKDETRSFTNELKKMYTYINKLPGYPRIICIPHQITTMTVYNTKADVLVNADNPGLMKVTDFYPVLKVSIKDLVKRYGLNYLLLRESFVKAEDLKIKNPKIVHRSGDIVLIKL